MDLAETGEEEEEEEEGVEEERLSGCSSLKFTHRTGAGPPPCLHASRAGQLLDSVLWHRSPAPICTIDSSSSSWKPGSTPGFSPAFSKSSSSSRRAYSASTSPPRGRTTAAAAALRSSVSSAALLLSPPGRRGVKSPRALLFKWRCLPRRAGRGVAAAAVDRHAAALAWSRRYAAALGFCTKNHCILVGLAGLDASVRTGGRGGGAGGKVRITARCPSAGRCHHAAREAGKYRSRGAPFQTHTHTPNTRAGCAVVPPPAASALIWSVRARGAGPAGGRAEISLVLQKKVLMKY